MPEWPVRLLDSRAVVLLFLHFAVPEIEVYSVKVILGMAGALRCSWWMLLTDQTTGFGVPAISLLIDPIQVRLWKKAKDLWHHWPLFSSVPTLLVPHSQSGCRRSFVGQEQVKRRWMKELKKSSKKSSSCAVHPCEA